MELLVIVGIILAIINPVIGGVLVGYIVWLNNPDTGFQLIVLSFTVLSLMIIGFIVWAGKKMRKLERRINLLEGNKQG
jgi:multisubunit Na+/H+ antiporter MnhB subunit